MRRMIGTLLVVVSVLLMAVTVLGVIAELADVPGDLNEDQQLALLAGLLFAGVLLILEVVGFLVGRHLRQAAPAELAEAVARPVGRRPGSLALYLGGSIGVALLAAFLPTMPELLRPVWFLVGQPVVFAQILFGGLLGVKLDSGIGTQVIVVTVNLVYFLILFYPLYRIFTMDRAVEALCYRRMRTLLILFGTVHLLLTGAFATLIRA